MPAIRTRPENLPTGLLLAGAGGFLDAYTFVGRGGVFANAQTGNIVLLAVAAGERHWSAALLHATADTGLHARSSARRDAGTAHGRRIVARPARFVLVAEIRSSAYRLRATPSGAGSGRAAIEPRWAAAGCPASTGAASARPASTTSSARTPAAAFEAYDRRGTDRTWPRLSTPSSTPPSTRLPIAQLAIACVTARPDVISTILAARPLKARITSGCHAARLPLTRAPPDGTLGTGQTARSRTSAARRAVRPPRRRPSGR